MDLCHSISSVAKRLYTNYIDPLTVVPHALNKNPGVRPIGIGDTARRIIAKAVLRVRHPGSCRFVAALCWPNIWYRSGCAHCSLFQQDETDAVLLMDASNAFDSLNHLSVLYTTSCPPLATALIDSYRASTELFVDREVIYSSEGTTQGDPLCQCMRLQPSPSSRSCTVKSMMSSKFGMPMTPLQLVKSDGYENGGILFAHEQATYSYCTLE